MKLVKLAILFLFLLCIALFGASVYVFLAKRAETEKRITVEGELTTQKVENKKLTLAYDELGKAKEATEVQLADEKKKNEQMIQALDEEKKKSEALEKQLGEVKTDYQKMTQELEMLQQQYKDLAKQGAPFIAAQPAEKLKTEIELPPVVVTASPDEPGKVLTVNRDFNFVVIDRGASEGIVKGEFLFLSREGKPVARIQVDKVYDHFSACGIVEESKSSPIREGDLAAKP